MHRTDTTHTLLPARRNGRLRSAADPKTEVDFGLPHADTVELGHGLQDLLSDLLLLSAQMKQGHWNLRGAGFRSIHLQLDEIVVALREHVDDVAERMSTLGLVADGRVSTTNERATLAPFPGGLVDVRETVATLSDHLESMVRKGRQHLRRMGELDPITEDLVIGMVGSLEKHQWMLRSHLKSLQ